MQKQFKGFLSSTANPGQLSLTASSFTNAIISAAALFAVAKGMDAQAVTSQVQSIIDTSVTAVTAGLTVYHTCLTVYGLARKLWYSVAAKPVVTVEAPVAVAQPVSAVVGQ